MSTSILVRKMQEAAKKKVSMIFMSRLFR
nr:hypothetical protein [uncultured Mitsuokella sp.]